MDRKIYHFYEIAMMLVIPAHLVAQLPDAPKPHIDKMQISGEIIDAGAHSLDIYSTHQMLANGDRELFLPSAIANHPQVMAAYEGAVMGTEWYASRELKRHGHTRLANWIPYVDAASTLPWAIHNLYLPRAK